jgi:hypothetical protein
MRRAGWLLIVVVLIATACGGAGAHGKAARDDGHVRATIMFVGDSNVGFALSPVAFALTQADPSFAIVDVARAGTGVRLPADFWKVRLGEALPRSKPDGFVVNLGINDTVTAGSTNGIGYADYGAKVDWLLRLLPSAKPVWWTNLPCDIEPADRAVGCQAVNAALAAAPKRWRNLTVLDFAAQARRHHEYLLPSLGGVHLAGRGGVAWANLVAHALDARFPG